MARIETYPFDLAPTVNDYVIGTDGDNSNATRNYKVMTFLDYLGTQYNLNSTDMLFEYDDVISTAVGDGYVSTNNYADGTILMSGVTNIYVSKITGFGQLVEDALNSIGTNTLTIVFADMGNRNNYGIFDVVSAADVDANTINLTVTATTTLGSLSAGKVMGIRIGIGGGSISDTVYGAGWNADTTTGASKNALYDKIETLVTLDTVQTVAGAKTFSAQMTANNGILVNEVFIEDALYIDNTVGNFANTTGGLVISAQSNGDDLRIGLGSNGATDNLIHDMGAITGSKRVTWQNADGTVAFLSDLTGGYVDLTSVQSVGGIKSFTDLLTVKNSMWINGGSNKITFANSSESSASSTSGLTVYSKAGSLGWALPDTSPSNRRGIFTNANTGERTYTFQDADGTVAHTSDIPTVSDTAYNATSWNANTDAASKNAIRDEFENKPNIDSDSGTTGITAAGTVSGTHTIGSQGWKWYQVGRIVFFAFEIINCGGSSTGELAIDITTSTTIPPISVSPIADLTFVCRCELLGTNYYSVKALSQSSKIKLLLQTSLDGTDTKLSGASFGGTTSIFVSGSYLAANPV